MFQYKAKDGVSSTTDGIGHSNTFVDAIAKFGTQLCQGNLPSTYVCVGNLFNGAPS